MNDIVRDLFLVFFAEFAVIILALVFKENKKRMAIVLAVGTLLIGCLWLAINIKPSPPSTPKSGRASSTAWTPKAVMDMPPCTPTPFCAGPSRSL